MTAFVTTYDGARRGGGPPKSGKFQETPNILMIQLKRFGGEKESDWETKNTTEVDFPLTLSMSKYTVEKISQTVEDKNYNNCNEYEL